MRLRFPLCKIVVTDTGPVFKVYRSDRKRYIQFGFRLIVLLHL